jgi:predicted metal-dependent hydrolase
MVIQLELGGVTVDVVTKDIKNLHLSVYPPTGRVRIAAPLHMKLETIRVFAIAKLGWIKRQQRHVVGQDREAQREYLDRESHYVWGKRYLMKVLVSEGAPTVGLSHRQLVLSLRPNMGEERRGEILDAWYRAQVRAAMPALLARWQPLMGVKADRFFVQRMKTKWGSCTPSTQSIRLNTDLAKKPPGCLEYIVVHELAHLLEPTHNARFTVLMDRFLPNWRQLRDDLNRLPLRHVEWSY